MRHCQEDGHSKFGLYIHLPFCESLCTFCGCNKRITKNHGVERPYIATLIEEMRLYSVMAGRKIMVHEVHLGGGTPTFFSPRNLQKLFDGLRQYCTITADADLSFEGHPNNTTYEHLEILRDNGFDKVCYGVQDYNYLIQQAINRVQPYENVIRATHAARKLGYKTVGHDLVYGLPFQTLSDVKRTIDKTIALLPEKISLYSYAHVPWLKGNGQRGFKDTDLPSPELKRVMYAYGKKLLLDAGYMAVGFDHFALPSDPLFEAKENSKLHRNFMGYTTKKYDYLYRSRCVRYQ